MIFTSMLGYVTPKMAKAADVYAQDLFISEYIEGSGYNKVIEIFNGTASTVDLSEYRLELYSNGSPTASNTAALTGTLNNGDVYVLANSQAAAGILAIADITNNSVINFNGDDAVVLKHNGTIIDVFGQVGVDPGSYWGTLDYTTADHTLVRKSSITVGDINPGDAFDPSIEWDSNPKDSYNNLGAHTMDGSVQVEKVGQVIASPSSGAVEAGTEVILSTATEGARIYYTTDSAADPDTEYMLPIAVNEAVTIRAKAVKDGMSDSDISCFAYTIQPPAAVISIADARSHNVGDVVTVNGIVTFIDGSNYYIQDSTAGIDVYKSGLTLNVGDMVQVKGATAEYRSLLEIIPASTADVTLVSRGNALPEPELITIADAKSEAWESQRVKIKNVTIGAINSSGNTPITDSSSNTINIYKIPSLTDIVQGEKVDVTAVVSQFNDYQLRVGNANDVVKASTYALDLFISEYIEGSSNNKAIEVFNGTESPVDLSQYTVELYTNGSATSGYKLTLTGTLQSGDVYVIANSSAVADILSKSDITATVTYFNGDDALVLKKGTTIIDSFGQVGFDPGTAWGTGNETINHTLVRKSNIISGDTNTSDAFDPLTEWDVYPVDIFTYLGSHTMDGSGSEDDTTPPAIVHTPDVEGSIGNDFVISAVVTDNKVVQSVALYYRTKGDTAYKTLDMAPVSGQYTAAIPKEELNTAGLQYYIQASDGTNISTSPADKETPYEVTIAYVDAEGPIVTNLIPASGASTGDNKKPEISAEYSDLSGIDVSSIKLYVDDADVTADAVITESKVTYTPEEDLADGEHAVRLEVSDLALTPQKAIVTWNFWVGEIQYNWYFGQLHSHTNLSDGQGTPDQAYTWARDQSNADFFAITDHSNSFDNDTSCDIANGSASSEWNLLHQKADQYNVDGEFAAIAGYEMTWSGSTGGWGHMNTFNTSGFETRANSSMDLKTYYNTIAQYPQSISQFNHPGTTFGDFADFGFYSKAADDVVDLVEVGNGEGQIGSSGYFPSYEYYTRALDRGWHLAPSNNQDNHLGNWVTANTARTVVLAPKLTRDSVYDAIRNLRVYATEDSDLKIMYKVNGSIMGSTLDNPSSLNVSISFEDAEAADKIGKVSIISDGGSVAASKLFGSSSGTWDFTLNPQYTYYYVRIDQADGDIAVTAPVWTGEVVPVGISKVEVSQDPQIVNNPVDITATVYNNGETALSNVNVEFYKDSVAAENKIGEKSIASIGASSNGLATITWTPDTAGNYTLIARTVINTGGTDREFTGSTSLQAVNEGDLVKVVIDGGHYNQYVTGDYPGKMTALTAMLKEKGIMLVQNNDELTVSDLENAQVFIITDPASKDKTGILASNFTGDEVQVIKGFTDRGGSLVITSRADYDDNGVINPSYQSSAQGNRILEAIGSNLRFNDDEVIDDTSNGGQNYRLYFDDYTSSKYNLTSNIPEGLTYSAYSGCSVILKEGGSEANVDWLVKGHDTTGALDSDNQGDAVHVDKGDVKSLAAEILPNGAKIIVAGTTFFSDFETASVDNAYSNAQITKNIIKWTTLAELKTIAEVRVDADNNGIPDNLGKRYAVEGIVTSQSVGVGTNNAFFDVMYVQDSTGGLTIFGVSARPIPLGIKVRVTGRVGQYQGDSQIQILNENDEIDILDANPAPVEPRLMSTGDSMLESNEGWLVRVRGIVKSMNTEGGDNSLYIDDGSGMARVYVNGYIGDGTDNPDLYGKWDTAIKAGDIVSAVGLASEDPLGHRLRVRNTAEIVIVPADTTALLKAIAEASSLLDGAKEGTAVGEYKPGSKAVLQYAIAAASTVLSKSGVTQEEIDNAVSELNLAIEIFKNQSIVAAGMTREEFIQAVAAAVQSGQGEVIIPTGGILEGSVAVALDMVELARFNSIGLKVTLGEVEITVPCSVPDLSGFTGDTSKSVLKVSKEDLDQDNIGVPGNFKLLQKAFSVSMAIVDEGGISTEIPDFAGNMEIVVNLQGVDKKGLNSKNVSGYIYESAENWWYKIEGTFDTNAMTFSLTTTHPIIFTILKTNGQKFKGHPREN